MLKHIFSAGANVGALQAVPSACQGQRLSVLSGEMVGEFLHSSGEMVWGIYLRVGFARERGCVEIASSRKEPPSSSDLREAELLGSSGQRECE